MGKGDIRLQQHRNVWIAFDETWKALYKSVIIIIIIIIIYYYYWKLPPEQFYFDPATWWVVWANTKFATVKFYSFLLVFTARRYV